MTTSVTVRTVDWPVRVVTEEKTGQNFHATGEKVMPPHSEETFHIHQTMALRFEELPVEQDQPSTDRKVPLHQRMKDMGHDPVETKEDDKPSKK